MPNSFSAACETFLSSCVCRCLLSGVSPGAVDAQNYQAESNAEGLTQLERVNACENYGATPRYYIGAQTTY